MDALLTPTPGEITYLFQSINTAEWHDWIRTAAVVIALFVAILYLHYSVKAKKGKKPLPPRPKKEA